MIKLISQVNNPSGIRHEYSEDCVDHNLNTNVAWVIDGASASSNIRLLPGNRSDAHWLKSKLSRAFAAAAQNPTDLTSLTASAISSVRQSFLDACKTPVQSIPVNDLPTAAGLVMQYNKAGSTLNFLGLGDCIGLVMQNGKLIGQTNPTLKKQDEEARIWPDDPERTKAAYHAWKLGMNQPGGYGIFSIHENAINFAQLDSFQIDPSCPAHVLMMSDGLDRLVDTFETHTYESLMLKAIEDRNLHPLITELRKVETSRHKEPELKLTKMHDDASAILIEITPA